MKTQWFRAQSNVKGIEKVDLKKGIVFGVAVITEGEALGHGVHLEKSFVEDVTAHGNATKKGLKARFGHPNMSSSAIGTYVGRYKNFRTETIGGQAICRADLHLSKSAKKAPQGDLYTYILAMADKEADMFGLSIVFSKKCLYHYNEKGKRKEGRGHKTFVELGKPDDPDCGKLHACDVVDEPAANPSGLFSEFSSHLTAAKVTEFLDQNPEVLELYANKEIREAFLQKYQQSINQKEEQPMAEDNSGEELKNDPIKGRGILSKLAEMLGFSISFGSTSLNQHEEEEGEEDESEGDEEPATGEEFSEDAEDNENEPEEDKESEGMKALEAQIETLTKSLNLKDSEIKSLKSDLAKSNKKLSALGVALKASPKEQTPSKSGHNTFLEAVKTAQKEMGLSYEDAHKFCSKEYPELYPTKRQKAA